MTTNPDTRRRLRSMVDLAGPAVSPAPPHRGEPLPELSARMVGHVWTPDDHAHVVHVLSELDRTVIECVRRARERT